MKIFFTLVTLFLGIQINSLAQCTPPTPTITANHSCLGDENIYTTDAGMSNYVWTVSGGTITSGGTSADNTVTVNWGTTGVKTVTAGYTNSSGCTSIQPTYFQVTITPLPVPGIGTNFSNKTPYAGYIVLCSTDGLYPDFSADPLGVSDFVWTATNNVGTPHYGGRGFSVDAAYLPGYTQITLNYADANGCRAATPTALNIYTLQNPTISGATQSLCQNSTSTPLTIIDNQPGTVTYQWYQNTTNNNTGGIAIPGATALSYTPSTSTVGTFYYYAKVTGFCGTLTTVPSEPIYITTVSGWVYTNPQTQCINEPIDIIGAINGLGTSVVQWYRNTSPSNTGGVIMQGYTSTYITLPPVPGTSYYYFTVTNDCGSTVSSVSGPMTYNANIFTTQPSSSGQTVCLNAAFTPLNIAATGIGQLNYQWYSNSSNSNVGGTAIWGAYYSSYTPPPSSTIGSTWYYATVTGACGSATSNPSGAFTVTPLPSPVITGPTPVCFSSTAVPYSTPFVSGDTYSWSVTGGTIQSGAGTNAITVNWGATGTGTLSVIETSSIGCTKTSSIFNVTINSTRPTPAIINSDATGCIGQQTSFYTQPGKYSYAWTVTGGTFTGAGTDSIRVTWTTGGLQTVTLNYANTPYGCSASSPISRSVGISGPPATPTFVTGSAIGCNGAGAGNSLYSTQSGKFNYVWTVTGGTITYGAGTNQINVTWNTLGAQTITVNYANVSGGCKANTPGVQNVTVYTEPSFTSVTMGGTAVDYNCLNYIDYRIGTYTIVATPSTGSVVFSLGDVNGVVSSYSQSGNTFTFTASSYQIFQINMSTTTNGCTAYGCLIFKKGGGTNNQRVAAHPTDKEPESAKTFYPDGLAYYPNPADKSLTITVGEPLLTESPITIYDLTGRLMTSSAIPQGEQEKIISTEFLIPGLYLLRVSDNYKEHFVKVIIRRD